LLRDISVGGVFLKTITPFTVGRPITLIISSKDGQMNIKVHGEVVRVASDGVGIQLIQKK
jgi:Tfp pilus assembly protein PilZ